MTILNREELTSLIAHQADVCVSLYMPTQTACREQQRDPIRLKNLLAQAREQLVGRGIAPSDVHEILGPAESYRNDETCWTQGQEGLTLFCSPRLFRRYQLPLTLETKVHVDTRFYIRPLLQLLHGNARFFVLALTQDNAQLFEATRYTIRNLNIEATLASEEGTAGRSEGQTLPFRTRGTIPVGDGPAMCHGHGGAAEVNKQGITKHFQVVDRAVSKLLQGVQAPLVLACVGYLASIYESTNSYAGLIKGKIPGNPDMWQEDELRDRAWHLVSPILNQHRENALSRFEEASGTDKVATDVRTVVLAANDGRVDTLFLEQNRQVWGNIDRDVRAVLIHGQDGGDGNELLDDAAAHTLIYGGSVYALERDRLPVAGTAATALLRYAASHPQTDAQQANRI